VGTAACWLKGTKIRIKEHGEDKKALTLKDRNQSVAKKYGKEKIVSRQSTISEKDGQGSPLSVVSTAQNKKRRTARMKGGVICQRAALTKGKGRKSKKRENAATRSTKGHFHLEI